MRFLIRYCAIGQSLSLAKTGGVPGYAVLLDLAQNPAIPLAERANAVKRVAQQSGQLFDREHASDPSYWKGTDLEF